MNYTEVYVKMRKITKLLAFALAMVMAIPVFVNADKTTASEKEVLLEVNVGNETGEVGYELYDDGSKLGPQAFIVKNNKIYILDTVHDQILVYVNDKLQKTVPICDLAFDFTIHDNRFWVVDEYNQLFEINEKGEVLSKYDIPDEIFSCMIRDIRMNKDGNVVLQIDGGFSYELREQNFEKFDSDIQVVETEESVTIAFEENGWEFQKDNKYIGLLEVDKKDNCYVFVQTYLGDVTELIFEHSIEKYNAEGELEEYAIIDMSDNVYFSNKSIYVSDKGSIYLMECEEDSLVISELILGTSDESQMEHLREEYERTHPVSYANSRAITSATSYISLKRDEVKNRASAMANFEFEVTAAHKTIRTGTELPGYIASAAIGEVVTGIPYCWGGFNGYGSASVSGSFANMVTGNYMAGNVDTSTSGKVGGTIGLDCSGFVCSAYGLTEKKPTSTLLTFGNEISSSNLKYMDFLVKNGHTVLYSSTSGSYYYIYDASTATGKVAYRRMPISNYSNYTARTPWKKLCDLPTTYSYNSTSHWSVCTDCGYQNKSAHSFTVYTTYKQCTVCGYKVSVANGVK